jgi:hypothetical protein
VTYICTQTIKKIRQQFQGEKPSKLFSFNWQQKRGFRAMETKKTAPTSGAAAMALQGEPIGEGRQSP